MKIKIDSFKGSVSNPFVSVFTDEGNEIKRVRSLNFFCEVGHVPVIYLETFGLSDQEFEILNADCHMNISSHDLKEIPTELLKEELKNREEV